MTPKLYVLMVGTSNAGVQYWRLVSWATAAHRVGAGYFGVLGWDKKSTDLAEWQFQIHDQRYSHLARELEALATRADVIIFQTVHTQPALSMLYALRDRFPDKPIVTESDDDVFNVAEYNPASQSYRPGSELMRVAQAQFKASDAMIVSTPYLREVYSEFCPNIYVMPNSIDLKEWGRAKRRARAGLRLGWIGGASHGEDLRLLENVIPGLSEKHNFKLIVCSSSVPEWLKKIVNVKAVEKWVDITAYPRHLAAQGFDIGIAPLIDNKFNRSKSNLRWLEYAALGIPCVASRVGHFAETITDGVNGFLADGPEEWAAKLSILMADRKRRKEMGWAAYKTVAERFNVDKNIERYAAALSEIVDRGPLNRVPTINVGVEEPDDSPIPVDKLEVKTMPEFDPSMVGS